MSYLLYKCGQGNNNGSTLTNYGTGGAAYDGHATRNQQNQYSWGPLNANNDGIIVPGGISSPNNHSWQMHLVINQWWPILGIVNLTLCGNDGKLWSIGANTAYGYIHGETNNGAPTGRHYFTVEVANASHLNVEFWVGINGARPVRIPPDNMGYEGQIYIAFSALELQLGVDYFFQINVSTDSAGGSEYCIGNCLQMGSGCSDYRVTGFPMGCYIYSWREDNFLQNFSSGGSWAEDMAGGSGGGGGTPKPPAPTCWDVAMQGNRHIWIGVWDSKGDLTHTDWPIKSNCRISGMCGHINCAGEWIPNSPSVVQLEVHAYPGVNKSLTTTAAARGEWIVNSNVMPNADTGEIAFNLSSDQTGTFSYFAKAPDNFPPASDQIEITWGAAEAPSPGETDTPTESTPTDITLPSVTPVPSASNAGLTVILRDHKKKE